MGGFKLFTRLFVDLDRTNSSNKKVELLARYFQEAPPSDSLWAVAIMTGKRPPRSIQTNLLRQWTAEHAGLPLWLFEESYHIVGDLAETIALVLPDPIHSDTQSLTEWIHAIRGIKTEEEENKKQFLIHSWSCLLPMERFVFNKILTGGFRIGVAKKTVIKALSLYSKKDEAHIAHRLIGKWSPDHQSFRELLFEDSILDDLSKPYPFLLAYPIEEKPQSLGAIQNFQFEYKWDGIRGQLILRNGHLFVWTRGEELVTDKYPEFASLAQSNLADVVLDGEILAFKEGSPLPFQLLQKRINRKTVGKKILTDIPIIFRAYDLLEYNGEDVRGWTLGERRKKLESLIHKFESPHLLLSEKLEPLSWEEASRLRDGAREYLAEGLMVKSLDASYEVGRKKNNWWKWKVDPFTIDGVLLYAMRGHGRRSGLYTDYTFAVWDHDKLVPFTKAYSGLTDEEFKEITQFVNKNTLERFGPVRSVKPELVFELAFEGIGPSSRHKSGVALRFPRMLRWRKDKKAKDANTLQDLQALISEA